MLHLSLVTPSPLVPQVLDYLSASEFVINVVHLPNAAHKPRGDLITFDVAREEGSAALAALRAMGCETYGTIVVESLDAALSPLAQQAERHAAGSAADAVVWEEVASKASESAELSFSFLCFMILATLIAAIGILTDSVILIIGAMVVGPEFGPVAGICVGVVQRRFDLAGRSLAALVVGLPLSMALAYGMTLLLILLGIAPAQIAPGHPQTLFISRPDAYSALIALFAGVAGMVSLTTAKSGALIGVLISVTTVPAAGNVAVAAAYGNFPELRGASLQLVINVTMLLVSGITTVHVQRLAFVRRLQRREPAASA